MNQPFKHTIARFVFFVILTILISPFSHAQLSATAEINKQEIRIGDPIELKLSLIIPKELQHQPFILPTFKDTITKNIEIIETQKTDTVQQSNHLIIQQKYLISAYDSGQFILPSIPFRLKNDTHQVIFTNTLLITVHTVPTDTSETSVKDIKPIFDEPFDIKWYMPLIIKSIIGLLVLAAIIFGIYWYLKRKKKPAAPPKPKLPPHIIALEKLNQIKQEEIWKEGKIKDYYSAISDTIREYIEGRFDTPALEQTSYETLQSLKYKAIAPSTREKLQYIFEISDLVKFAKLIPVEHDHIQTLQSAFDFVNDTKQEFTPANSNEPNQPDNKNTQ
ncbi:MAG: hypothetical protein Fur0023_21960 [Bacteroidia bacterium]